MDDDGKCVLCDQEEECIFHVFLECKVTYQVWMNVYKWFGISPSIINNQKSHFLQHEGLWEKKKWKGDMEWTVVFTSWAIWGMRNNQSV